MDKQFYAVKVLHKSMIIKKNEQNHIMAERNVLTKNLKHPFLVSLYYSFQTADKLYFVLDYANGGELFFHLQKERIFPEPRARFYAAEIGSAIGCVFRNFRKIMNYFRKIVKNFQKIFKKFSKNFEIFL